MKSQSDYLTEKKPFSALIVFALPMIVGNLFQQLYTMTDTAIVGRYVGETSLAAVGASYALTNVFICIAIGGGIGASVVVSKYFGGKRYKEMKTAVYTAVFSFLAVSILLGIFGILFSRQMMIALKTPKDALDISVSYLKIYFYGLPFLFMYNVFSAMFNALGKSRIPLIFLMFSSILNVGLDVWMVKDLGLGVQGAAWATLLAQGIAMIFSCIIFLYTIRKFKSDSAKLFDVSEFGRMTKIALPSILQQSTISIGMLLVQSVVNSFGSVVLAGFSAGMRIETICIVPMSGMGNAISSYTAQNIGAGKKDRVSKGIKAAAGIVSVCALVICVVLELFNRQLIEVFTENGSALAMKTGQDYLRFIGFFFVLIGFKMIFDGVLRGAGDMKVFTIANLVNLSIRVSLSMLFAPIWGVEVVWYVVPVGWFANMMISGIRYRSGKWKQVA